MTSDQLQLDAGFAPKYLRRRQDAAYHRLRPDKTLPRVLVDEIRGRFYAEDSLK